DGRHGGGRTAAARDHSEPRARARGARPLRRLSRGLDDSSPPGARSSRPRAPPPLRALHGGLDDAPPRGLRPCPVEESGPPVVPSPRARARRREPRLRCLVRARRPGRAPVHAVGSFTVPTVGPYGSPWCPITL